MVKIQLHTHSKQEKVQFHWKMQHTHKGTGIPLSHILVSFHTRINRLPVEPLPNVFPDECTELIYTQVYSTTTSALSFYHYKWMLWHTWTTRWGRGQRSAWREGNWTQPLYWAAYLWGCRQVYQVITVLYSPIHLYCLYNALIYFQALLMLPMLNMKQPWSTKRESSFKTHCMWCWLLLCAGATLSTMCHVGLRLLILVKTMLNQMIPCLMKKSMRHNLRWWSEGIYYQWLTNLCMCLVLLYFCILVCIQTRERGRWKGWWSPNGQGTHQYMVKTCVFVWTAPRLRA